MSGIDLNSVSTIIATILAIFVGYMYPKIKLLHKTIVLNKAQVVKLKSIIETLNKAISDGKITPEETKQIITKIEGLFETKESGELEEVAKVIIGMLENK